MKPILGCLVMGITLLGASAVKQYKGEEAATGPALFWQNPADIATRNLFFGPGGSGHQPHGPYTFLQEDMEGTTPKFDVRDGGGVKWKVKLGVEAKPETAATRLVWAVGYFATEDYFLPEMQVEGLPHLHRGQNSVGPDGAVQNVRLKRMDGKKIGIWRWRDNPFTGTREWQGLRVMMALMNNWDLKDINNAIYRTDANERIYLVSDLGASFGTTALRLPHSKSKGNLKSYSHSKFIHHLHEETVDFYVPGRPELLYLFHPVDFFTHVHTEWIGRDISRTDAAWVGGLLAQLSHEQIADVFRAAGYSPEEVAGFTAVVEQRIATLTHL